MKQLSEDTSLEMQAKHYEMMRSLSPQRRLKLASELTDTLRKLIITDLRRRFPKDSDEQIRRRFIARVLPREDVLCAYGFDPNDL
jgi:hypothetical protein